MAAALTVIVVAHLAESHAWMLFADGDSLVTVLVTKSLAAGQEQDWAMSPVLFIPETVVYAILSLLGLGIRATLTLNAAVNFLALYAATRIVAGGRQHVCRPVARSVMTFTSICLLALLDGRARTGYQLASELSMTTHYSATVIAMVATLGLVRRASTTGMRGHRRLTLSIVLISALSTLTNPLYAGWVALPVITVLLVLAITRLQSTVTLTTALIAGTLLGMMLRIPLTPWIVADSRNYLHPDRWNASLTHYADLIQQTLNTAAGTTSLILMAGLWIASVAIAVVAIQRRNAEAVLVGLCACLTPVVTLAGVIAMGTEAARYLQPWAFMPALALTVLPLPETIRALGPRTAALRSLATATAALVLAIATLSSLSRVIAAAVADDPDLRCVTEWIDASGRTGAGQFWTARAPKAYSSDPGEIIQTDHQLNVYTWLTNRTDRIDADVTYLIVDANSYPFSFPRGIPGKAPTNIECGRYTILDFCPRALQLGSSWP